MKMTIDEIFNEAIMSETPAILVEGVNDIKIYTSLAKSVSKPCEVYAIEVIDGYSGGCGHVEKAINSLYDLNDVTHPVENFILGIIDRDTQEYRNTLPTKPAILVLNHYSIESHFVCEEVLLSLIKLFIRVHPDALTQEFLDELFKRVENELMDLYYFSLEALQCAIDSSYAADFKYSFAVNRRKNEHERAAVLSKKEQLDELAAKWGIKPDRASLMSIASGKWLLSVFCQAVESTFTGFSGYCGQYGMQQCEFCRVVSSDKCSYKLKGAVSHPVLYSLASECLDIPSLEYIRHRISQISLVTVH